VIALVILAGMAGAALGVILAGMLAGAALGVILAGMLAAGRREDDCRACRGDKAFRVADEEVRREVV